ncbi:MAG: hypothetical protein ACKVRN_04975 [Pyrinomonadaceae bacterium]
MNCLLTRSLTLGFLWLVILAFVTNAQTTREKSVLLTGEEAKKLAAQCSRLSPSDFTHTWIPSQKQINTMEVNLGGISRLKAKACCIGGERIENAEQWYLQYAALVWKGRKIIYISAVSTEKPLGPCFDKDGIIFDEFCEYWKQRASIVCDGGTNWGVIYNVASGKFSNLAVNGI